MRVLLAKGQICDGDIIQDDVEEESSLSQYSPDVSADYLFPFTVLL